MPVENVKQTASPAGRAALLGILAALALALSILEGLLPAIPIPGAKLGLSNIVTMYALTSLGFPAALAITVVKAVFAMLRGGAAAIMSLCGGLLSTLVMWLALRLIGRRVSFIGIGVLGAVAHNAGQLLAAMVLLSPAIAAYGPWLLVMALVAGILTGLTLNMVMPGLSVLTKSMRL